jgi:hypothetical protein
VNPIWAYITPRYDAYTWYGEACSAGGSGQPYYSTEYFPLLLAKALTRCLGLPGALDLRVLGPLFALAVGAAVGWTAHLLPGALWMRLTVASGLGLATVDSAIAPYLISPLSEPAALVGMLLLIPAMLTLLRRDVVRARDVALLAGVAAWTIGAKEQTASILVAVIPVLLLRPSRVLAGRRNPVARLVNGCRARRAAFAACGLLAAGTAAFQAVQPRWLNEIVRYDAVFGEILGHSHHVAADVRSLGLPASFADSAGSTMVSPDSASALPEYQAFLDHDGMGTVLRFYAAHPTRLFGVADQGLIGMSAARPTYLGNYLPGGGRTPYARECRICFAESLFTMAEPERWLVYPVLWGGTLLMGWFVARRGRSAHAKATGVVLAATAGALIAQFWAVMLSEGGSDLQKHMVFVIYGTLLLGPLFVAALGGFDQPAPVDSDPVSEAAAHGTPDQATDSGSAGVSVPSSRIGPRPAVEVRSGS